MRILQVNDTEEGGGAEAVYKDTVAALSTFHHVEVQSYTSDSDRTAFSYIFSQRHFRAFLNKLNQSRPHIIHFHNYYHYLSPSVLLAAAIYKRSSPSARVFFTAHDHHLLFPNSSLLHYSRGGSPLVYEGTLPPGLIKLLFTRTDLRGTLYSNLKIVQWVVAYRLFKLHRAFDVVLVPSRYLFGMISRGYPGLTIKLLSNPLPQGILRQNLGQNSGMHFPEASRLKLVFWGRLSPEKRLPQFLLWLDRAMSTCVIPAQVEVLIIGDGPELGAIQEARKRLVHVELQYRASVPRDTIKDAVRSAHCFVHASMCENSPVTVMEAAALGLPVAVSNTPGLVESAMRTRKYYVFDLSEPQSACDLLKWIPKQLDSPNSLETCVADDCDLRNYGIKLLDLYTAEFD